MHTYMNDNLSRPGYGFLGIDSLCVDLLKRIKVFINKRLYSFYRICLDVVVTLLVISSDNEINKCFNFFVRMTTRELLVTTRGCANPAL